MKKSLAILLTMAMLLVSVPMSSVSAEEDLYTRFQGAVVMYVGSPNAVVDNMDMMIDESNFDIVPIIRNGRTLLPIRFVGQSFGTQVAWDAKNATVTVKSSNQYIKLKLGSNRMYHNGKTVTLDSSPVMQGGRVYIPLRALSDAFGKKLTYVRNVIVMSDSTTLDAVKDRELIDYITASLSKHKKDPYTGKSLTTEQLAQYEQSVVVLESLDSNGESAGFGSAFSVGYGLFLTNYHVVVDAHDYLIYTSKDQVYEVEGVVATDEDADLALVKTRMRTNVPPIRIGDAAKLVKGESIVAIGNPEGLQNTVSTGIVSSIRMIEGFRVLQITAPITYGSSGGPLLNRKGEVVGVNTMGSEQGNLNFAISIQYAQDWIKKYQAMPFSAIPVMNQTLFHPTSEDAGGIDAPGDPGTGSSTPETGVVPETNQPTELPAEPVVLNGNVQLVEGLIGQMIAHPDQPVTYLTDESNNTIFAYNYADKKYTAASVSFTKVPRKLYFANGELFAIFSNAQYSPYRFDEHQGGSVVVLDPVTLSVKDQWSTKIDAYDLAVDAAGHVYVSSGSGQWTDIISYDRMTHAELSSRMIDDASSITLHPSENRIYAVNSGMSPLDFEMFAITDGQLVSSIGSPYHGDYDLKSYQGLTPDGKYVVNGSGSVFYANESMTFVTAIEGFDFFAADRGTPQFFYTAAGNTILKRESATLKEVGKISAQGEILRLSVTKNTVIALTKVKLPDLPAPQIAIEVFSIN